MADIIVVKAFIPLSEAFLQYGRINGIANPSATTNQVMQGLFDNWSDTLEYMVQKYWQPERLYEENAVILSPNMPKGFHAYAKRTGTTSISEPEWKATDGAEVNDGSVIWVMKKEIFILPKVIADVVDGDKLTFKYSDESEKKIAIVKTINKKSPDDQGDVEVSAALVGDVFYRPYLAPNHVKANGATVNRSDYPTLKDFADKNNMWTTNPTNEPWKYGVGDGSKTMVLPDYRGRVIQGGDIPVKVEAGAPIIKGTLWTAYAQGNPKPTGAFTQSTPITGSNIGSPTLFWNEYTLDASRCSTVFGNSDTIQPPAIQLIPQIKY